MAGGGFRALPARRAPERPGRRVWPPGLGPASALQILIAETAGQGCRAESAKPGGQGEGERCRAGGAALSLPG